MDGQKDHQRSGLELLSAVKNFGIYNKGENTNKYLGKLTLGKAHGPGDPPTYWYQHKGEITNLNVFG